MLKRPKHTHTLCDALTVYTLAIETTRDVEFLDYRNSSMEHNVLSFFFFFCLCNEVQCCFRPCGLSLCGRKQSFKISSFVFIPQKKESHTILELVNKCSF